jgi:hypothetical protein
MERCAGLFKGTVAGLFMPERYQAPAATMRSPTAPAAMSAGSDRCFATDLIGLTVVGLPTSSE